MNNNSNNQKSDKSDIITKKGFLISLPGKKKTDPSVSTINLAKPQNEPKNQDKNIADKNNGDNRQNKNNKDLHKNKKHNNRDKKNNNPNNNNNNNNNNNQQRKDDVKKPQQNNNHSLQQNNNQNAQKPHENNHEFSKHNHKNFNKKNKGNFKNKRADFDENSKTEVKNNQQTIKTLPDAEVVKQTEPAVKQVQNVNISTGFAPLGNKKQKFSSVDDVFSSELSLEEKYKNAKPLAEQIKEQELRQKGIKVSENVPSEDLQDDKQEIVGIRFREAGKIYYFDPDGAKIAFGTPVIVETSRGSEYGITAISNRFVPTSSLAAPLKKIERLATNIDTQKHVANKTLEADAEKVFLEKVEKLGLPMKLIYVEYTFDNTRLLFYFTAETRIDFRELVKELASVFRTRIELRQIGVRDEAKVLGGLGVCGRPNCCNTFLGDFAQVSIKMAKDQSLSLNAAKISGSCGKLMCCLRYEDKVYEEENQRTPRVGSIVETPEGKGCVVERNALKGIVNVHLDLAPEAPAKPFHREEVTVIGFNKEKGGDDSHDDNLDELKDVE